MTFDGTIGYSTSVRGEPCRKIGGGVWRCPDNCREPRHGQPPKPPAAQPCGHPAANRSSDNDGHTRCLDCRAVNRVAYNAKRRVA